MTTITHEKRSSREKSQEIVRFLQVMKALNLKYVDIARETEIPERTITSFVWENKSLGGQLLRKLHMKFGVSLDWILSGAGSMFWRTDDKSAEPVGQYAVKPVEDPRDKRMLMFVDQFIHSASADEKTWLEIQLKLHVPQYVNFLEERRE